MELFHKAKAVALRSHHEKYLHAQEDKESVRQGTNGLSKGARWTVELVTGSDSVIRLKSFYGKYLTATNHPFLTGLTGRKVLQTLPSRLDSTVDWEPIKYGNRIRLKSCYSQWFLRANGYWPPWRNWITHCTADGLGILHNSDLEWQVDILEMHLEGTTSQMPVCGNVPSTSYAPPRVVAYYSPAPIQRDNLYMERAELVAEVGNLLVSTASLMLRDADYGGAAGVEDVTGVLDAIGNADDVTEDVCEEY